MKEQFNKAIIMFLNNSPGKWQRPTVPVLCLCFARGQGNVPGRFCVDTSSLPRKRLPEGLCCCSTALDVPCAVRSLGDPFLHLLHLPVRDPDGSLRLLLPLLTLAILLFQMPRGQQASAGCEHLGPPSCPTKLLCPLQAGEEGKGAKQPTGY